jgi:hypothetical protein
MAKFFMKQLSWPITTLNLNPDGLEIVLILNASVQYY